MPSDRDRIFDDIASVLRQDAPIDSKLDERVMAAVRVLPRHGRFNLFTRLMNPRTVTVTPLSWGVLAASALIFAAGAGAAVSAAVRAHDSARAVASTGPRMTQFTVVAPNASKVSLVGDFNGWDPTHPAFQAQRRGGNVWTVTAPIPVGTHEYSFVVDDSLWIADPMAPGVIDNDFGIPKSAMIVGNDR